MKLAKKVLAAVMAIAMIAGLSAMAFAASPTIALVPEVDGTDVSVTVVLKDAIGAKSWDVNITYDKDVLEFSYAEDGADVAEVAKTKSNTITTDYNGDTAGLVKTSGYFKTELTDAATFEADSKKASNPAKVNAEACEVIVLCFELKDTTKASTDFVVEVTANSGVEFAGGTYTLKLKDEVPSSEDKTDESKTDESKTDESKTDESKTDEKNTDTPNPSTKPQPNTGDNMALAAAAAVVVLAGAAFVVSKKRK